MSHKHTTEEFIEKAKKIHEDKYSYGKVNYINNHTKVIITCNKHNKDFEQTPASHLRGCGCPDCANELRSKIKRSSLEDLIEKAREIHGDRYDYSKIEYINYDKKVEIICPTHGSFFQSLRHHITRGHGCPECNGGILSTTEQFIEKAKKIHGDKYDYSKSNYINAITPVEIICKIHNNESFWQTPHTHITGKGGCPKCSRIGLSKLEEEIENYLRLNNIAFEEQYTWDWLVYDRNQWVDFYLPDYCSVIECQGLQHFVEVEHFGNFDITWNRDINKNKLCLEHGIKIYYFSNIKKTYRSDFEYPYQVFEDLDELIKQIKEEHLSD